MHTFHLSYSLATPRGILAEVGFTHLRHTNRLFFQRGNLVIYVQKRAKLCYTHINNVLYIETYHFMPNLNHMGACGHVHICMDM